MTYIKPAVVYHDSPAICATSPTSSVPGGRVLVLLRSVTIDDTESPPTSTPPLLLTVPSSSSLVAEDEEEEEGLS